MRQIATFPKIAFEIKINLYLGTKNLKAYICLLTGKINFMFKDTSVKMFNFINKNLTLNVLVIDENKEIKEFLLNNFLFFRYKVSFYHDPIQALADFEVSFHKYDAVIVDIFSSMKTNDNMIAFDLLRKLRSINQIPILIWSNALHKLILNSYELVNLCFVNKSDFKGIDSIAKWLNNIESRLLKSRELVTNPV